METGPVSQEKEKAMRQTEALWETITALNIMILHQVGDSYVKWN